jgi:hypothetical protein
MPMQTCNSDSECPGAPANICSAGHCLPGCAAGGACPAGLVCDVDSGHCRTPAPTCARDTDCDPGSYCTQSGQCLVLAYGGSGNCPDGVTAVLYACATKETAADFAACVGSAGPFGCPYCIDNSCFHPGLCASGADCHAGDACIGGLCVVQPSSSPSAPTPCPSVVDIGDVIKGVYAAGKEVCVRGTVMQMRSGLDGEYEIRLGQLPFVYVDVEPMYVHGGVVLPKLGATVTVHGVVRWDAGHADRELLPVDWIGAD